jgi:hypothetical protein
MKQSLKPSMTIGFKNKINFRLCIKILSKLFSNQQEDVLETFEI